MGSFDCYCVLCSGPLGIGYAEFGSRKGKALRKRRLRVERYKRKLAGERLNVPEVESGDDDEEMEDAPDHEAIEKARIEQQEQEDDDADSDYENSSASSSEYAGSVDSRDVHTEWIPDCNIRPRTSEPEPEEEEISDDWSQTPDLPLDQYFDPHKEKDEYEENHSYDPAVLQIKDIKWLDRCRAIAMNASVGKAYISGRGRYDDYGSFDIKQPGRDPNDTGEDCLNCTAYTEGEDVSFPFHEACFEILARSLGYARGREVDRDFMYWVFKARMNNARGSLDLVYGLRSECGQFWENLPGEEYSVCDPSPQTDSEEELQSMLPASLLGKASESVDLTHKVRNDPFSVLPYDVLLDIFERVDTKDMLSLMKASHHIDTTTRENAFWKHMIRIRVLPWFSELRSFVESTISDAIDYKGLFLWIDHLTRPEFGNQGPLIGMAVANRRRIWSAVQDLVPLYKSRVAPPPISPLQPEDTKEAQNILDSAVCIHMPLTLFPLPKESTPISTQFIKSWNEISHSSCDFDTFWDKKDGPYFPVLIGISVTFPGHQPRIFGSTQGTPGNPLHIEAGLWIRQIVLRIDEVDMFHHDQDRSMVEGKADARPKWDAGITGMQVVLSSGKEKDVKSSHRGHQRPMVVCEGMCLIGLTGEVASNGAISRLGLLQAPLPHSAPSSVFPPQYTSAQKMLWNSRNAFPPNAQGKHSFIWNNRTIQHHPLPSLLLSEYDPPADMLPYGVFLWASRPEDLGAVNSIAVFQPAGPLPSLLPAPDVDSSSTSSTNPIPEILSIRPGTHTSLSGCGYTVGNGGYPVPFQHPLWYSFPHTKQLQDIPSEVHELYPSTTPQHGRAFNPLFTKEFAVEGGKGERITEVGVSRDYGALRFVTSCGRKIVFGDENWGKGKERKEDEEGGKEEGKKGGKDGWYTRVVAPDEVFLGITTQFGKLSAWSEGMKMWSHMRLSGVGVVFVRVDGEGKAVAGAE